MATSNRETALNVGFAITCLIQLIIPIFIIVTGVGLSNYCVDFHFNKPFIVIGIAMLVIGLIGCIGFGCKDGRAAIAYFVLMVVPLICMIVVIIKWSKYTRYSSVVVVPAEAVANQPEAAGAAYIKEHPLDHFSGFYRRKVTSGIYQWDQIANCLAPTNGCASLDHTTTYNSSQQTPNLTPLQMGCCMPPPQCGYTFASPTNGTTNNNNQTNVDCARWNVDPSKLCYSCDSCKAGVLVTITKRFKSANGNLLITFVMALIVWVVNIILACIDPQEYNWNE
ncbi:hypothetical protein DM860_005928 [Cuscuta australis]|uniref:Tetraspanin n=1 Tax=Cuscuta australis TaxID=267555 RepID=A0A328DS94_9ASTE|nr:hypothetical protein DM860_005928 [Cuscuta australis]